MKGGYVCLDFQPISVIVNNSNQLKTKFNVIFKYKPKKNARLQNILRITYFHLECQNRIETSNIVLFLDPCLLYFFPNLFECNFVINKINLIIFINVALFIKKIQDSNINSTKLGDNTKNLCYHIEHTLLYLWLKYGENLSKYS
jgi:hypothetical protein